jgi:hypothetical protein
MSLEAIIQAELELRHRRRTGKQLIAPSDWQQWCRILFPKYFTAPFAQRHIELWQWMESVQPDNYVRAFLAFWGRGGAKSTNAEAGTVKIGADERRRYALYVSSTQDKADTHVANIAGMIETEQFGKYYHKMAMRAKGKFGNIKGWRREHLQAANGFSVDAFGLDSGLRGIKIDEVRPDIIILDDIDEKFESPKVTLKKMQTITDTVLPSGSKNCAVLFIQNMISADSIASRLLDMRADFLRDRIVSGPFPAIDDFEYELRDHLFIITGGTPTWAGQDLETCQAQINLWGISAFRREAQHEVDLTGGIWDGIEWWHIAEPDLPLFRRKVCWVDPAITDKPESSSQGISIGGLTMDDVMIGLYFWEGVDSPESCLERAIYKAWQWGCEQIGVETNQGGDTWKSVYKLAAAKVTEKIEKEWRFENPGRSNVPPVSLPKFTDAKAGAGDGPKIERNGQLLTEYERGKVKHMLGTHQVIEKSLRRFPNPPLDLADSWWWVWSDLIGKKKKKAGAWGKGIL